MQKRILALAIATSLVVGCQQKSETEAPAQAAETQAVTAFNTEELKVAYGAGRSIGQNIKGQLGELDVDAFLVGLKDTLEGKESQVSEEEIMTAMKSYQEKMRTQRAAEHEAKGAANKTEGEQFLAENGKKEGVVTTDSGLQYKVLVKGEGAVPEAGDVVEVNYRGTFINGEEFDSSYKRGQSVSFPVTGVIQGWVEALQMMPVGSKWELYIPSDLAYGPGGTGRIGPNKALVFEVELLAIKPKEEQAEK